MPVGILFLAITLLAYFPVLGGQFVWDDHTLIQGNRFIRSPVMLSEIFTHHLHIGATTPYYRPFQNVSFLIDYLIWGENSSGFHLTNILLQAICGWLLYQLLRQILPVLLESSSGMVTKRTNQLALILALLWVIHPAHNAAVAYISGRADPLSFVFAAAAVCLTLSSLQWRGSWKRAAIFGFAWVLGLAALCTRESAACWLMLVALCVCFFEPKYSRRTCGMMIAALLALLACWLLLRQLPPPVSAAPSPFVPTAPERVVLIFRALGDYTRLLVAPITLTMDRPLWPEWRQVAVTWTNFPLHFGWLGSLGFGVVILALIGAAWRCGGQQLRIFGAAWFGLCFLPISNLFPLNSHVAEHWMYLASIGGLLFVTGFAVALPEKWFRRIALVAIVGFLPLMLLRTNLRASDWADPIRLFTQTIEATGGNPRLFNNLAAAYENKGDKAQAEQIYRLGLDQYPTYPSLLGNLGKLLARQGRTEEAEALLAKAQTFAQEKKHTARRAWSASLASSRIKMDEAPPEKVLAQLKSAREETPEDWELMRSYLRALEKVEGTDAAIAALERFAWQWWWYKEPRILLARTWLEKREPDKALVELRHAARLDVWDALPHSEIAAIEVERKNLLEALKAQQNAVRRAPDSPKQRAALAYILHELGRQPESITQFHKYKKLEQLGQKTRD